MAGEPVVLFDGTCNFCDGAVRFLIDHERGSALRFAALQSTAGSELLDRVCTPEEAKLLREGARGDGDPESMALVEDGRLYTYSTGALRTARYLRWPWRALAVFVLVPRFVRDAVYRWFAGHRYRWFGKAATCRVPTPELRARFLA